MTKKLNIIIKLLKAILVGQGKTDEEIRALTGERPPKPPVNG